MPSAPKLPPVPQNEKLDQIKDYMKKHRAAEIIDDAINIAAVGQPPNCMGVIIKHLSKFELSPQIEKFLVRKEAVVSEDEDEVNYLELYTKFREESGVIVSSMKLLVESEIVSLLKKVNGKIEKNQLVISSIADFDKLISEIDQQFEIKDKFLLSFTYAHATCRLHDPYRPFHGLDVYVHTNIKPETQTILISALSFLQYELGLIVWSAAKTAMSSASEFISKYQTIMESLNTAVLAKMAAIAAAAGQEPKKKDAKKVPGNGATSPTGATMYTDPNNQLDLPTLMEVVNEVLNKTKTANFLSLSAFIKNSDTFPKADIEKAQSIGDLRLVYNASDIVKISECDSISTILTKYQSSNSILAITEYDRVDYGLLLAMARNSQFQNIQIAPPKSVPGGPAALEKLFKS